MSKVKPLLQSSLCLMMLGIAILWMSADVVWLGDDLDYKYMMKGEIWQSWGRIKTTKDFFDSQWIHYRHVNGRWVSHALVQLFNARLGQYWFAICNALVYMLFAFLLGRAGMVRLTENPRGIISAICLSVLCFITKMMPTCQIGYIWGMTVNIGWLILFFKKGKFSWLATIALMTVGIIAGNWQESISVGVCGGLGIWWVAQLIESKRHHDRKFDWRRSWILLSYVIGTATNCIAPSTMGRVSDIDMPIFDQLLIATYSFPAIIMLITCILYVRNKYSDLKLFSFKDSDGDIPEGILTTAIIFIIVFNVVIGIYSNRQLFGANMFAAILTLQILPKHRFGFLLNTLALLTILAFWTLMILAYSEVRKQYYEIINLHSQSSDGSVCYDRTRVMTLGIPLRAKYYEDILGQFDNDLHHSLMKDLKHTRKGRGLKLKPTISPNEEKVERYAPGHFTVTLKEPPKGEAPREIIIYGHYLFSGLQAAPRRLDVTKYSKRHSPYATAVIIPEFPFFTADSISIIER